jgi:hypothetical protein
MKKLKPKQYRIRDTVTYSRTWLVEATSEADALTQANNEGPPDDGSYQEVQITATAYTAVEEKP